MSRKVKNYTVVFINRSGKEYVELQPQENYPEIIKTEGKTARKEQVTDAILCMGITGMVLAHWHVADPEDKITAIYTHPGVNVRKMSKTIKVGVEPEPDPTPVEDPVERIKRQAKARLFPADMSANEPADNNGFPKPQPWVEPEEIAL